MPVSTGEVNIPKSTFLSKIAGENICKTTSAIVKKRVIEYLILKMGKNCTHSINALCPRLLGKISVKQHQQ
jgi:hypothetical protein